MKLSAMKVLHIMCHVVCYQILEILPAVHMCTIAQMNLLLDSHYRNIIVITGNYYIYSVEIKLKSTCI
jgi:hypothetical protein